MARSAIAWSSGTRTLVYSGRTAPEQIEADFSHALSFSVSPLIFVHLPILTEILIELFHYFFKDNAVLKALLSMNG